MATRRAEKPYIWVTWLAKLLGGDLECLWSAWFRAHYRYEKYEEMAGDLQKWNADHARLVRKKELELKKLGYTVTTEQQNDFKVEGAVAVVAGKPDIVATMPPGTLPEHAIILDAKTGRRRSADWWQILIYLYFLPKKVTTLPAELSGEIVYGQQDAVTVEPTELSAARKDDIVAMIKVIAGDEPPKKVPSREECKRCNVGPADCPERVRATPRHAVTTKDF